MTELRDAEGVARGEDTASLHFAGKTLDQRFWDLLLPQLFGVIILLGLVAGCSIFRQIRVQQYSTEYLSSCEDGVRLRILYPRTLPVRFDDSRGLPIALTMGPIDKPHLVTVRAAPPLELRTAEGVRLTGPIRLTPSENTGTVYVRHEPLSRTVVGSASHIISVEPPAEAGCQAPVAGWQAWSARVGAGEMTRPVAGTPLQIRIAAEDQARGYFYALVSFLSNPEVWGGLVVGLVGGGLSLQLARQERRERLKHSRERQEREQREQEQQRRTRREREQQLRRQREKEKREAVTQQIVAIRRAMVENVEEGMLAFNQLARQLADDPVFQEELATLKDEVFSTHTFMKLLKRANQACRTEDHEQLERSLLRVVRGFDPSTLSPYHRHLYTAAACNVSPAAVNPLDAANALLELWDREQYEYYELIVRGLQQLWRGLGQEAENGLEAHLRERFSAGRQLRDILRDARLRTLPTATDFESSLPKVPLYDKASDPLEQDSAPYNVLLDPRQVAGVALPVRRQRLFHSSSMLLVAKHAYDKLLLTHMLHRESRHYWPVVASYDPEAGNLLSEPAFLARLCRALGEAWITLLKTVPTADLLMGETASLLSALLLWCYGGTSGGVAHALATATPIFERERHSDSQAGSERAERLLVQRLASQVMPPLEGAHVESALQHWLTLTPYGYRRNLFILIDEGISPGHAACWIDDREWASLAKRGCLLKIVTERPGYFRLSPSLGVVPAEWRPDDIVSALETVRTYPLAREVFTPAESRRWQDAFDGASVERVIASHAGDSLGQAIDMANSLIADAQAGGRRLTVEAVRSRLG